MQKLSPLSYQTSQIEMSTTTFESLVRNLGQNIRRMNIKIQFGTKQQKQSFTLSEQRYKEREEAISLQSEEQNDGQPVTSQEANQVLKENRKGRQMRQIEVRFEISILLQSKYYRDKFQKIGRRLGVKFMVVPSKVKIIGYANENFDQACIEFGYIQDRIRFIPITEYGQEVYQSRFYKQLLKQNKLELLKMLNKYYLWFEEGIEDPNTVIDEVFRKIRHKLLPLKKLNTNQRNPLECEPIKVVHGQFSNLKMKTSVYKELIARMKATIFEKYICNELNRLQKHEEKKVQLSQDRQYIILHLQAEEQIFIQEQNIKEMYKPFKFTFFYFNSEVDLEYLSNFVQNYKEGDRGFSKKKKSRTETIPCFMQIIQNVLLIAIYEKQLQGFNVTKTEESIQVNYQEHYLLKFCRQLPVELLHFKLVIQTVLQNTQQQSQFKKFSFQNDYIEKITYISCKNNRLKYYQMMLQCYLQKKFDQDYRSKREELNNGKIDVSMSAEMDISRPIDQSSIMMNASLNQSLVIGNTRAVDVSTQSILPHGLQLPVFRFENYGFYLQQKKEQRQIKFTDKTQKTKRTQTQLRNGEYENSIRQASTCKYKMYKINIPIKFKCINLQESISKILQAHPQLEKYNKWVTVFYGGKEPKDHDNIYSEEVKVKVLRVISENLHIMIEGYLLQTNLIFMYREFMEHSKVELPLGTYEGLCFVKKTSA